MLVQFLVLIPLTPAESRVKTHFPARPDVVLNTIPLGRTVKLRDKTSFIYHRDGNSNFGFSLF